MFNITNNEVPKYQRYLLKLMGKLESGATKRMYPILQQAYDKAASNLEHGQEDMTILIEDHRKKVFDQLTKEYHNVLAYFGTFTFDQFEKEYRKNTLQPQKKAMEDVYWQEVNQWANVSVLYKARKISETTEKLIHSLIRSGMRAGLSNNDIVKELTEKRKKFNKIRASRIVRTETHSAANKAINSSVKSTGYQHIRIWLATKDDRVRGADPKDIANHLVANGQRRDMDTPFDIKFGAFTDKLDFPGDPKARPAQTVNCRCVLSYHTKRIRE